jgi:hypothetical protein
LPAVTLQAGHGTLELPAPARAGHWRVRVQALGRNGAIGSGDDELITR